jgi:hypothetical protein
MRVGAASPGKSIAAAAVVAEHVGRVTDGMRVVPGG